MANQDSNSLNLLSDTTTIQTITQTITNVQNIEISDVANLQSDLTAINSNISNLNTNLNSTNTTVAANNTALANAIASIVTT